MDDSAGVQIDPETVIAHLEQRLGQAFGQIARMEVAIGELVRQHAEAANPPAPAPAPDAS